MYPLGQPAQVQILSAPAAFLPLLLVIVIVGVSLGFLEFVHSSITLPFFTLLVFLEFGIVHDFNLCGIPL